jgi:hypothetical protein
MKRQQTSSFTGKQLSRTAMKSLKGGITAPLVWVCILDDTCYYVWKINCLITCEDPAACKRFTVCP